MTKSKRKNHKRNRRRRRGTAPRVDALAAALATKHFSDKGSRLPDGHTFPTTPYHVEMRQPLTTQATGAVACLIDPGQMKDVLFANPTFTAGDFPISARGTGTDVPEYSAILSSFSRYRVTNIHIDVEYNGAPLNASGDIAVKMFPAVELGSVNFPTLFSGSSPLMKYYRARDGCSIVVPPFDLTYREFRDIAARTIDESSAIPYPGVAIYGSGLPASTQCLMVTLRMNVELLAEPGDFSSRLAEVHPDSRLNHGALEQISNTHAALTEHGMEVLRGPSSNCMSHIARAQRFITGAANTATNMAKMATSAAQTYQAVKTAYNTGRSAAGALGLLETAAEDAALGVVAL